MTASVVEAAAVNPNITKTLLANVLSTFFMNGKAFVFNDIKKLINLPF